MRACRTLLATFLAAHLNSRSLSSTAPYDDVSNIRQTLPGVETAQASADPHEVVIAARDGEGGVAADELGATRGDVILERGAAAHLEEHVLVEKAHALGWGGEVAEDEARAELLSAPRAGRSRGAATAAHTLYVGAVVHGGRPGSRAPLNPRLSEATLSRGAFAKWQFLLSRCPSTRWGSRAGVTTRMPKSVRSVDQDTPLVGGGGGAGARGVRSGLLGFRVRKVTYHTQCLGFRV